MLSGPTQTAPHAHGFDLDTGVLALDFANTLDDRYESEPTDRLRSYPDLLAFAVLADVLDQPTADRLANAAAQQAETAERQIGQARKLREAIFGVFSAIAGGSAPSQADLDVVNAFHQRAISRGKVVTTDDGFDWAWEGEDAFDRPLWPVVKSAIDLLLTGDQRRMRECAADDCGWLFYDTSRNQSRRWCSMQSCGNRAKVQQFRERKRGA